MGFCGSILSTVEEGTTSYLPRCFPQTRKEEEQSCRALQSPNGRAPVMWKGGSTVVFMCWWKQNLTLVLSLPPNLLSEVSRVQLFKRYRSMGHLHSQWLSQSALKTHLINTAHITVLSRSSLRQLQILFQKTYL